MRRTRQRLAVTAVLAAGASVALTGCSGGSDEAGGSGATSTGSSGQSASASPTAGSSSQASSGGSTGASSSEESSDAGASAAVLTISDFKYQTPKSVKPGQKIMIKNTDDVAHTVTADDQGGFDVNVPGGGTATLTAPGKSGDFAFHCEYHSNMHGTLTVS